MKAWFLTAVVNGSLAPTLTGFIMRVSNNREIMGERINGHLLNLTGSTTAAVMSAAAIALVVTWVL
jgi:Mn2+/Fe2+ NRAMP family transporter